MPTPRRVKRSEASPNSNRNRILSAVGVIVILAMFLSLVITPGVNSVTDRNEPTATVHQLSNDDIIATINALQATSAAATPTITPTGVSTPVATPPPAFTVAP